MKHRLQYIFTWVALGLFLLSAVALLVVAWNGLILERPRPFIMSIFWILISASGIYLFLLAVKKAHRSWIQEKQNIKQEEQQETREVSRPKKDEDSLDFAGVAKKLIRRTPDGVRLKDAGDQWLKNLARELEIMSGILYLRKGSSFEMAAGYALAGSEKPYVFKEGEGLSGQVAKTRQIRILTGLPEGFKEVYSGLGKAEPKYLAIVPLVSNDRTVAILECSGYRYNPGEIESMFRIFSRDLMEKISPNLK